ncbi:MAG: S9 family peptidase [Candidatus Aminicenantes bacterium]|jgi:dipeptidyl-peptidase-4
MITKYTQRYLLAIFVLILFLSPFALAQDKGETITVEWIYSNKSAEISSLPSATWLNDGKILLYDNRKPPKERTFEFLDPASGERTPALDKEKALSSFKELMEKPFPQRILFRPLIVDLNGQRTAYLYQGDVFVLELASSEFTRVTETDKPEKCPSFSPDGKKLAYVRNNDLFVYDLDAHLEEQLTYDDSETLLNGTLSWVYWEEVFGRRDIGYWWSPDSTAIAFLQTDESPVGIAYFLDHRAIYPKLIEQRHPKTGTANPVVRVGINDLDKGKTTWVDLGQDSYEYIIRVKWLPNSKKLSVQTMNRNQDRLDLYITDLASGETTHILTEANDSWINIHDDLHFLENGKGFIWASERDGYNHLYLYTMDGKLVNQITKGEWALASSGGGAYWVRQAITAIDEAQNWVYFTALKKSSLERHLYRIRLDGTGLEKLSDEAGTHGVSFSRDAAYYLDRYSNISTPPSLTLHKNDGTRISALAKSKTEIPEKLGMRHPEIFTIPAEDGFPLPAQIYKPEDFDPNKKYPLILNVYGGPSAPEVSNSWHFGYFEQILLRKGYLVASVDNRSATGISKILEDTILKNTMGDGELGDLVAAVRWFKAQPYIDPERVGIWGWSGGGTFTLLAMTRSQEFKAGIAVAAVTAWRYYDSIWAEALMKLPDENPEGFEKNDLNRYAKDLHGRLLIVHGTYDDNVHIQNIWTFVDELIKANKMFDLMIYPMRKHGIADRAARVHLYTKMLEFWKKNL